MTVQSKVNLADGMVSPSPPRELKHERSNDDEEESTRRVLQRTEKDKDGDEETPSMKKLVLENLQSDNTKILEQALYQIRVNMRAENAAEASKEFYRLGGHSIVVLCVMRKHPTCVGIQEQAIAVIANVAFMGEFKVVLAEVNAMQAVLEAMNTFQNERLIQYYGLQALINFIDGNDVNARNLAVDAKGVPAILKAMHGFSGDEEIVRKGCSVVSSLCRMKDLWEPIFDTDALTALAKARDTHKKNDCIRKYVTKAMKIFSEYSQSL